MPDGRYDPPALTCHFALDPCDQSVETAPPRHPQRLFQAQQRKKVVGKRLDLRRIGVGQSVHQEGHKPPYCGGFFGNLGLQPHPAGSHVDPQIDGCLTFLDPARRGNRNCLPFGRQRGQFLAQFD